MQRTANPCTSVQFRYRPPTNFTVLFRLSSAVEQSAVNRSVVCSNQTAGAKEKNHPLRMVFLCVGCPVRTDDVTQKPRLSLSQRQAGFCHSREFILRLPKQPPVLQQPSRSRQTPEHSRPKLPSLPLSPTLPHLRHQPPT